VKTFVIHTGERVAPEKEPMIEGIRAVDSEAVTNILPCCHYQWTGSWEKANLKLEQVGNDPCVTCTNAAVDGPPGMDAPSSPEYVPCCDYALKHDGYYGPYQQLRPEKVGDGPCTAGIQGLRGTGPIGATGPVGVDNPSPINWPQIETERYTWTETFWILLLFFSVLALIFYW
jgi:hypothetical protein